MPRSQWAARAFRTSSAPFLGDLGDAGTLLGRWKIESTGQSLVNGNKFTLWADISGDADAAFNQLGKDGFVANGGLTYRSSVAAFGNIPAAEAAASTDGMYVQSGFFNGGNAITRPFTLVVFGKMGAAPINGDIIGGNVNCYPVGKAAGSATAGGPGGNSLGWTGSTTTVAVFVVVFNTTTGNSQKYYNGSADGAAGNLGTTNFTGEIGIGNNGTNATAAGTQVNEMAFFAGDVSGHLSDVIMPYFRTKSGLALV